MLFQPPVFETIFCIPAAHRLMIIGSRSRGGPADGVLWFHTEHDASGTAIARYETFDETDEAGRVRCGWRKYDARGRLLARHEIAMRWSQMVRMSSRREAEIALRGPAAGRTEGPRREPHGLAA
ncbi:hypothetical protein [Methylobacterium sp. ID0610]|uniref:hypothetical protein n=1 Tax=Methylobacterium carpenticola TaxID=3344827 RepID=UPI0036B7785E